MSIEFSIPVCSTGAVKVDLYIPPSHHCLRDVLVSQHFHGAHVHPGVGWETDTVVKKWIYFSNSQSETRILYESIQHVGFALRLIKIPKLNKSHNGMDEIL